MYNGRESDGDDADGSLILIGDDCDGDDDDDDADVKGW